MKKKLITLLLVLALCICTLSAALADEVSINLESNPTKGFMWTFAVEGEAVTVAEGDIQAASADLAGAPVEQVFLLNGAKAGEALVTFTYARDWEEAGDSEKVIIKVLVAEDLSVTYETVSDTRAMVIADENTPKMTVALHANATTGYLWTVDVQGDAVKATEKNYLVDDSADGLVGVGGIQPYAIEGVKEGTATLTFTYAQVGAEDAAAANILTLQVAVNANLDVSVVR